VPYREPEPQERKRATPAYLEGPIAWEDPSRSLPLRFWRTLGSTFLPTETVRAVAEGTPGPALRFGLLSALPWAPLWAIIPFTHTLQFKARFALEELSKPGLSTEFDVARAMIVGLVLSLLFFVSWALPYASLLRAFAGGHDPGEVTRAAWRNALYRVWIVPLGMTLFWLVTWAMPPEPPPIAMEVALLFFTMLPRLLIVLHCHAMARYFGASGGVAVLVSVMPLLVEWAASQLVWHAAQGLLPPMPEGLAGGDGA
jgi:hypothetical protein